MEITVRRLESADLGERVAWFNTPAIYTRMLVSAPLTETRTQRWFDERPVDGSRHDFSFLAGLCVDDNPSLCAMGGLTGVSELHKRGELYIVVNPKAANRGIGTACIKWLCDFGFLELQLRRIELQTFQSNLVACRIYQRLGFVEEGILREHVFHRGRFVDRHVQALLSKEWEQQTWHSEPPLAYLISTEGVTSCDNSP